MVKVAPGFADRNIYLQNLFSLFPAGSVSRG